MISQEGESFVIRIAGDNIVTLQRISEEIVSFLYNFCRTNSMKIDFKTEGNIEILETKNRNVVSEGVVLVNRKDRLFVAIKEKKLEFSIAVIGLLSLIALLYITYLYRDPSLTGNNLDLKWGLDIAGKLIGSAFITTITAGLNFIFYYNSLKMVNWKYPSSIV